MPIELLNGPSLLRYRRVRDDWFALLRQGIVRTATANSDSHRAGEIAAAPRNLDPHGRRSRELR